MSAQYMFLHTCIDFIGQQFFCGCNRLLYHYNELSNSINTIDIKTLNDNIICMQSLAQVVERLKCLLRAKVKALKGVIL